MKLAVYLFFVGFSMSSVLAQTRTITGTGNWDDQTKWSGGTATDIADNINENASFSTCLTLLIYDMLYWDMLVYLILKK